jgi:GH35 family endo-1,4-beta-xylanase
MGVGFLVAGLGLMAMGIPGWMPRWVKAGGVVMGGFLAVGALAVMVPVVKANSEPAPAWAEMQRWAAEKTPKDALFLTPTMENNARLYSWRVHSQRSVVGEWRDGTQLYFNARFAKDWWKEMNDLQPGMVMDASGKARMNRGQSLDQQDDEVILKIAKAYEEKYKAQGKMYIVLPTSENHYLKKAQGNAEWTIYRPEFETPEGVTQDPSLPVENKFIGQKALGNIEKYRKSDATVTVVDAAGKPVAGAQVAITQTSSAFGFGSSLSFFKVPEVDTKADYKAPAVTEAEKARFLEAFNYSVMPFSGQWRFMEPTDGKVDYSDLDMYVDWCVKNGVRPEFRFVSGYQPRWVRGKVSADVGKYIERRATDLAKRYGTKIMDWQVTSEDIGVKQAAGVFAALRKELPSARLGIADDGKFWSMRTGAQGQDDRLRGLKTLQDLKKAGVEVDYIAVAAKHPTGLWASGKDIYETLDAYAKEGVKVHITEFGVAVGDRIEGSVREGTWTPEMRAQYYEMFFTVCFSHPAVEAINVMGMGPKTWLDGQGLLDEKYVPTEAFLRLKELTTKKWRTTVNEKADARGMVKFRGFQGGYQVKVTLPGGAGGSGGGATGTFEVVDLSKSGVSLGANDVRFVVEGERLKRVER